MSDVDHRIDDFVLRVRHACSNDDFQTLLEKRDFLALKLKAPICRLDDYWNEKYNRAMLIVNNEIKRRNAKTND